jgi:peptide/nickel transport system permease protein
MLVFAVRRLLLALITVIVVSIIVFLLVHLGTGGPGVIALGQGATPDEIDAYNQKVGWNDPLVLQYWSWISGAATGNFGVSSTDGRDIIKDLGVRLPVTASLAGGATLLSAALGIILGVTAAVRRGWTDRFVSVFAGLAVSIPSFWLGIVLVYLFAVQSSILPATGYVPFDFSPSLWAASLALPVLTLAIGGSAFIARQTRASMTEALAQEHIRTLRATGTPTWRILYIHALRYASLPIVASIALQFIALFGGSVIVEQLFAMPGIGLAIQAAVGQADSPTIQAIVVVATLVVVIVNLALELLTRFLDPKLRAS